jgi:PhnB protein
VGAVLAAGGEIVQDVDPSAQEKLASVRDPAGNVFGIYEQPGLADPASGQSVPARAASPVAPVPEHLHTVTARLVLSSSDRAIDFYRRAFDAEEIGERFTGPDGEVIHAELRIGDSIVMLTDEAGDGATAPSPESLDGAVGVVMATYWEDVDQAWARAIEAGAEVVFPLSDHFYGERGGRLRDPLGQQWMLSQRVEILTHEEIARRATQLSGPTD